MGVTPRRFSSHSLALVMTLLLSVGSGSAEDDKYDLAGVYDLTGKTVIGETGAEFILTGKMVIKQEGDHLETFVESDVKRAKGKTGPASLSFISHGSATLNGDRLAGVSDIQTIYAQVPGVDVSAPYMPKRAGPAFKAITTGKVIGVGEIEFLIKSDTQVFGPGANRVTTLRAIRVARKASELKPVSERKQRKRPPAPVPIDPLTN